MDTRSVCGQSLEVLRTLVLKDLWVGKIFKVVWHNPQYKSSSDVPLNGSLGVWPRKVNLPISQHSLLHLRTVLMVISPKEEIFILSRSDPRTFSQETL